MIYPHAVCEIARTYRFRNVGGTSAGAIAGVAGAAAEYGRLSATGGFKRLAELPMWFGSKQNLFHLFQPQKRTRALYKLFTAPIRGGGSAPLNLLGAALSGWWPLFLVGSIPAWLSLLAHGTARGILIGVGIILILLASLGFTIWGDPPFRNEGHPGKPLRPLRWHAGTERHAGGADAMVGADYRGASRPGPTRSCPECGVGEDWRNLNP